VALDRDSTPVVERSKQSIAQHFLTLIRTYLSRPLRHAQLIIHSGGHEISTRTDGHGQFSAELDNHSNMPVRIYIPGDQQELQIIQSYPVRHSLSGSLFDVISDLDDTAIISHSVKNLRRIQKLAFTPAARRDVIPFTQLLFKGLREFHPTYFYVSKSESNLFNMLSKFLVSNELPQGVLFLSPYLGLRQLLLSRKDANFKINTIHTILSCTRKKYILVGDDSQQDIEVYAQVVRDYPQRVIAVFIHKTRRTLKGQTHLAWQYLLSTNVFCRLFTNSESPVQDIERIKAIVDTSK